MYSLVMVFRKSAASLGLVESKRISMMRVWPAARTLRLEAAARRVDSRSLRGVGCGRLRALRHAGMRPVGEPRASGPAARIFLAVRSIRVSLWRILIWVWMSDRAVYPPVSVTGETSLTLRKFWLMSWISREVRAW